jgi:iron complex outermembrane receptor protein
MKQVSFRTLQKVLPLLLGLFLSVGVFAQQVKVSGHVVDKNGEPIIGANVVVKGTTNGTITDYDGNFSFLAPSNAVITISFVGYKPQEVKAGQNLNIVLQDDAVMLEGVVAIGYGTMKKSDLSGSVVSVSADDIDKGSITSPQELLQGQVSGLFIQPPGGGPGEGATMRIRGGASLNATNDPLIVIDGIPVSHDAAPGMRNPLSAINPNDIESMTVLKDASAAAIYGSRASNGVIIITTKKGTNDDLKVSYSSTYSVSDAYKRFDVLSAPELREQLEKIYPKGTDLGTSLRALLGQYPDMSTDWQDQIFRTGVGTDQNVSVAGKAGFLPFRVSLGYKNENGTLKKSNYERYTANVVLTPSFFDDHLKLTLNAKGTINNNEFGNTGAVGAAAFYDPTKPVYAEAGSVHDFNGFYNVVGANDKANSQLPTNPVSLLEDRVDHGKTKRFIGSAKAEYKVHFLPELKLTLNVGLDIARGEGYNYNNIGSYEVSKGSEFAGIGIRSDWNNFRRNQLLDFYANYAKELPTIKSRFDITAGYSWQHFYQSDWSEQTNNYVEDLSGVVAPGGWTLNQERNVYVKDGARRVPTESYLISFFARMNYSLMDRYLLTATLRQDGTSRFVDDNRWGLFPSLAFAWSVTNEPFMQEQSLFSNLKLRVGYGVTGQQDLGLDYGYIPSYIFSSNVNSTYFGLNLLKPGAANKNLKWEETATTNFAIDYGFLNNRINGSIEYYYKKTSDLLNTIPFPAGTNFTNEFVANIGEMENKGFEFNINAIPIQTKDITWNVGFNFTWNDSEITKLTARYNPEYQGINTGSLSGGTGYTIQKHQVGHAPSTFYLYKQLYDENGKPIQNGIADLNGDGKISEADRYMTEKSPMPDFYLGFNSSFRYKKWDVGFNMRANLGCYTFNDFASAHSTSRNFNDRGFIDNLHRTVYETGFVLANDRPQTASDYFLENSSFLKMDNITLGYNFDKLFTEKISGRISLSVQNVFTITNYKGLDPENGGIDAGGWPRPRTYTLGLNLNF